MVPSRRDEATLSSPSLGVITKKRGSRKGNNSRRSLNSFIQSLNLSPEELHEEALIRKRNRDYSFLFSEKNQNPCPISVNSLRACLERELNAHLYSGKNRVEKQGIVKSAVEAAGNCQDRIFKSPTKVSELGLKKTERGSPEKKKSEKDFSPENRLEKQGTTKPAAGATVHHKAQIFESPTKNSQLGLKKTDLGSLEKKKSDKDLCFGENRGEKKNPEGLAGESRKAEARRLKVVYGRRDLSKELGFPKPIQIM